MSKGVTKIRHNVELTLSTEEVAHLFCDLDDDAQAQFFVHVAATMRTWGGAKAEMQRLFIARHLRDCECTTEEAREWIRDLATTMDEPRVLAARAQQKETPSE